MPSDVGDEDLLDILDPNPPAERAVAATSVADRLNTDQDAAVRITGRYLVGVLDLRGSDVGSSVEFVGCRFAEPPNLEHATVREIRFASCWLPGLQGRHMRVDGDLAIENTTTDGRVDLTDARVGGSLVLADSRLAGADDTALVADRVKVGGDVVATGVEVTGGVRMENLRAGGDVLLAGAELSTTHRSALAGMGMRVGGNLDGLGMSVVGEFDLTGSRIDRDLILVSSRLVGHRPGGAALCAQGLTAGGNAYLNSIGITGGLRMGLARVGGSLVLSEAVLNESDEATTRWALDLDGAEIGVDLRADLLTVTGGVRFRDVSVRANALFYRANFVGKYRGVEAERFRTGGHFLCRHITFLGPVLLRDARIGGDLVLTSAHLAVASRSASFDIEVARIGGDLICDDVVVYGSFRMRLAKIGGSARFAETSFEETCVLDATGASANEFILMPGKSPGRVIMRHARCVTFTDNHILWTADHGVDVTDFRYAALGEPRAEYFQPGTSNWTLIGPHVSHILRHLSRTYQPSAYFQLATVLASAGDDQNVRNVLIQRRRQGYRARPVTAPLRWLLALWSFLLRRATGYGYRRGSATLTSVLVLLCGGVGVYYALNLPPLRWLLAVVAVFLVAAFATVATGIGQRTADERQLRAHAIPAWEPPKAIEAAATPQLPVAELRSVVAEEAGAAVRTALTGPELVKFTGFLAVELVSAVEDPQRAPGGPLVLAAARGIDLEVVLSAVRPMGVTDPSRTLSVDTVRIDSGREAERAEFDLVVDSATLDVTPRRALLVVETRREDSHRAGLSVSVPDEPGTHEAWVQLYQAGQLVQALTVVIQVGESDG